MAKEIERKFLVISDQYRKDSVSSLYRQGYILNSREKCVRVRVCNGKGLLTIKGATHGVTRSEFEYEIPLEEASIMLDLFCGDAILEKDRHILTHGGFRWEVDEFHGENEGLVVAEIELPEEDTEFPKPAWLGLEVSDDPRFYNNNLLTHPFKEWADMEIFEKAKSSDTETILALYRAAAESGSRNGSSDWNDSYPNNDILMDDLANHRLFVLRDNGVIISAVSLMERDDLDEEPLGWTEAKSCVPVRLCVSPERQRQGLGEKMMNLLIEYAKQEGYTAMRLLATKGNLAANRLYERMGYKNMGDVHLYDMDFVAYERLL